MPIIEIIALVILGGVGVTAIALPTRNRMPAIKAFFIRINPFKKK